MLLAAHVQHQQGTLKLLLNAPAGLNVIGLGHCAV
jgi:hypothetical protein